MTKKITRSNIIKYIILLYSVILINPIFANINLYKNNYLIIKNDSLIIKNDSLIFNNNNNLGALDSIYFKIINLDSTINSLTLYKNSSDDNWESIKKIYNIKNTENLFRIKINENNLEYFQLKAKIVLINGSIKTVFSKKIEIKVELLPVIKVIIHENKLFYAGDTIQISINTKSNIAIKQIKVELLNLDQKINLYNINFEYYIENYSKILKIPLPETSHEINELLLIYLDIYENEFTEVISTINIIDNINPKIEIIDYKYDEKQIFYNIDSLNISWISTDNRMNITDKLYFNNDGIITLINTMTGGKKNYFNLSLENNICKKCQIIIYVIDEVGLKDSTSTSFFEIQDTISPKIKLDKFIIPPIVGTNDSIKIHGNLYDNYKLSILIN